MNDVVHLTLSLIAGLALGATFFGGLWWTVRRAMPSRQPAIWVLTSLVLRTTVVLGGFYWIGGDHWQRLLMCLLGFVMARLVVLRLTRSGAGIAAAPPESGHAPQP